jgi:hypothetical protein
MKGKGPKNSYTVAANSVSRCNFSGRESSYCLLRIIFSSLLMIMMFYLSITEGWTGDEKEWNGASHRLSFLFPFTISFLMYRPQLCVALISFRKYLLLPSFFSHCLLHPLYIRTLLLSFINHNNILRKYVSIMTLFSFFLILVHTKWFTQGTFMSYMFLGFNSPLPPLRRLIVPYIILSKVKINTKAFLSSQIGPDHRFSANFLSSVPSVCLREKDLFPFHYNRVNIVCSSVLCLTFLISKILYMLLYVCH